jgi:3-hydroxyacyl-[acyl-carrier-protein] dehydratase
METQNRESEQRQVRGMDEKAREAGDLLGPFDIDQIMHKLPHRYPFLMVDRVLALEDNHRILCSKCVTINEPFFPGHFPGKPVMPGVMMLEAMAQSAALLARFSTAGIPDDKWVFLVGANDVKWKRMVRPGDTLHIEMKVVKKRRPLWILEGACTVDGKVVASGTISAMESD